MRRATRLSIRPRLQVHDQIKLHIWNRCGKIQSPVNKRAVDPGINRIQQELFSVHRARTLIGGVDSRSHPLEVANHVARNAGMNVSGLRSERWPHFAGRDGLGQVIRRSRSQGLINVRKMFAIKLVKVAVVR